MVFPPQLCEMSLGTFRRNMVEIPSDAHQLLCIRLKNQHITSPVNELLMKLINAGAERQLTDWTNRTPHIPSVVPAKKKKKDTWMPRSSTWTLLCLQRALLFAQCQGDNGRGILRVLITEHKVSGSSNLTAPRLWFDDSQCRVARWHTQRFKAPVTYGVMG